MPCNGLKIRVERSRHIISVEQARFSFFVWDMIEIVKGKMGGNIYLDFARENVGAEE
jgi:hypothetical protein